MTVQSERAAHRLSRISRPAQSRTHTSYYALHFRPNVRHEKAARFTPAARPPVDGRRGGRRRLSVGHMFGRPRRGRRTSRVHRTAGRYWSDGRLLDGGLRVASRQVRGTLRGQRQPVRLVRGGLLGPGKPLRGRFLRHVGRLERRHRHAGECSDRNGKWVHVFDDGQ